MTSKGLPREVVDWVLSSFPIRKDQAGASADAERTLKNERMLVALRLHAAGLNATDAAKAAGYSSHSEVARSARTFGFVPVDRAGVLTIYGHIAGLAAAEAVRRLEDHPEKISDNMLNALGGTAVDKMALAGGWQKADSDETRAQRQQQEFFARLEKAGGGRMTLDVTPTPEPRRLNGNGAG